MITLTLFLLQFVVAMYFCVAFVLFLSFIFRGYNITMTRFDTQEKKDIKGIKKILLCFGLSLIWPVVIKLNN